MSPGRSQSSVDTQADVVDANPLAARGAQIRRNFPLGALTRLHDVVADADAKAELSARFYLVDSKVAIAGRVQAPLHLVCQRCLQPMMVSIEDDFEVVLAATEGEMAELPEAQDAVIADAARLDLGWLTEEQLLLARPLAPMHASEAECERKRAPIAAEQSRDAKAETQHPFAGLRDLMNRRV